MSPNQGKTIQISRTLQVDPARAFDVLGWRARFGLPEILATAWQWHARSHLVG